MKIRETKCFIPKRFELGSTLDFDLVLWSMKYSKSSTYIGAVTGSSLRSHSGRSHFEAKSGTSERESLLSTQNFKNHEGGLPC